MVALLCLGRKNVIIFKAEVFALMEFMNKRGIAQCFVPFAIALLLSDCFYMVVASGNLFHNKG